MRGTEKLHYLIHSLTKTEKRYISLTLSKEKSAKGKKDLKLFELLKKQTRLNETDVTSYPEFASRHQLILRSQYLFDHILKCLIEYNLPKEPEIAIGNHIHTAKILILKGLHEYTHFHINRAQKLAEKYEDLLRLGILCNLKKRIAGRSSASQADFLIEMTQINELENEVHEKLSNLNQYNRHYNELQVVLKKNKGSSPDPITTKFLDRINRQPLFQGEKNALTKRARIVFHEVKAITANYLEHDNHLALKHTEKQMELVHSVVAFNKTNSPVYLNCLKNYCIFAAKSELFNKAEEGIRQLENLYRERSVTKNIFEQSLAFLALLEAKTRFVLSGKKEELTKLASDQLTQEASIFEKFFDGESKMVLHYYLAIRLFLSGNYRDAFSWLEKIIKGKHQGLRSDLLEDAHVLSLICIYEIDSVNLFQSRQRSYLRFYHNEKSKSATDRLIAQVAQVYQVKNNLESTRNTKRKFHEQVQHQMKEFEIGPVLGETILSWLRK